MRVTDYSRQVNVSFQSLLLTTYQPAPPLQLVRREVLRSRWVTGRKQLRKANDNAA